MTFFLLCLTFHHLLFNVSPPIQKIGNLSLSLFVTTYGCSFFLKNLWNLLIDYTYIYMSRDENINQNTVQYMKRESLRIIIIIIIIARVCPSLNWWGRAFRFGEGRGRVWTGGQHTKCRIYISVNDRLLQTPLTSCVFWLSCCCCCTNMFLLDHVDLIIKRESRHHHHLCDMDK
jgi:hypothetical protein